MDTVRARASGRLRLITYNVHGCIGTDGLVAPERVADVIATHRADVVALQEVDVGRLRSFGHHQPEVIAKRLSMEFLFCCTMTYGDERYGHAVLSHLPLRLVHTARLPSPHHEREQRSALWSQIDIAGESVQLVSTHLGLSRAERYAQCDALLGADWFGHEEFRGARIVCGDFNVVPITRTYSRLRGEFHDAQRRGGRRPRATFPSIFPLMRLDHVFVSDELHVRSVEVPWTRATRLASDHLPLIVELELRHAEQRA